MMAGERIEAHFHISIKQQAMGRGSVEDDREEEEADDNMRHSDDATLPIEALRELQTHQRRDLSGNCVVALLAGWLMRR